MHYHRYCGYKNYKAYLDSPVWEKKRKHYKCSAKIKICVICGNPEYTLHHLSYDHLGKERFDDLMPLCCKCHLLVHEYLKKNKLKVEQTYKAIKLIESDLNIVCAVPIKEYIPRENPDLKKKVKKKKDKSQPIVFTIKATSHEEIMKEINKKTKVIRNRHIIVYIKNSYTYTYGKMCDMILYGSNNTIEVKLIEGTEKYDNT